MGQEVEETQPDAPKAKLTKPAQIKPGHVLTKFDCGEEVMNIWLQKKALTAAIDQTARTFVVCRGRTVVGYYSLAASSISHEESTSSLRRNMPDPIPAILLARLAVDLTEQGSGLGKALFQDAALRTLRVAKNAAARTLIVHALDEKRARYYKEKLGFLPLPTGTGAFTLHLPLSKLEASLPKTRG
jgi:predicted N-acetyltransferase YhbS